MPNPAKVSPSSMQVSGTSVTVTSPDLAAAVKNKEPLKVAADVINTGIKTSDISLDAQGRVVITNAAFADTVNQAKLGVKPLETNVFFCNHNCGIIPA